ncbi:MAG: glutamate-5-semialdehyde dehydrogenase, partial [Clostridia bacterium]|nr:glutamate-5-semialdehyde dehydrogenase [Clostridia bacterium]
MTLLEMGKAAKAASHVLATATTMQKNEALAAMAKALKFHEPDILAANEQDVAAALEAGTKEALIDRLKLTSERLVGMAKGLLDVAMLSDPVGDLLEETTRPNGLRIRKLRVPLGVIGIIYEARPNVTSDAAGLCLKAGNATILRGGKEAIRSNTAVADALREGIAAAGLPADCVQLVTDTSRDSAKEMMHLNGYLDVLIPRGGAGLIRAVVSEATVPVIETGVGNCHVFVDAAADVEMATNIILNAKTSRPSVCNAAETLLV